MNAQARALAAEGVIIGKGICYSGNLALLYSKKILMLTLILVAVWFSAFGLVYIKECNRELVNELQTIQGQQDRLQVEWSQLLLEEGTMTTQARVHHLAMQQLHMITPNSSQVVMIEP